MLLLVSDTVTLIVNIPADPSLTSSRVLAAVESLSGVKLANAFMVPSPKREEHKEQSATKEDYKHATVTYYLSTYPSASWAHIGGRLLRYEEKKALRIVKEYIVPDQGTYVTRLGLTW